MQQEIDRILDQHAQWLASCRAEGRQAILSNYDLRFANLAGRDLREAVLIGTNLERSNLQSTRLAGADMTRCNLAYAELQSADLEGANLAGATIEGADLTGARLDHCILEGVNFESSILRTASLTSVNARKARFSRANMASAVLDAGWFDGAIFHSTDLTQASLQNVQMKGAALRRAILSGCELDGANFRDADLTDAILVGAITEGATFEGARGSKNTLEIDDETESQRHTGKSLQAAPTAISVMRNDRLHALLRMADQLKSVLRKSSADSNLVVAGNQEAQSSAVEYGRLVEQLREVEAQIKITQSEVRREQERVEKIQQEIKVRVDNAADALRNALSATNRIIRVQRWWSLLYRVAALLSVICGLSIAGLFAWKISVAPTEWESHAAWLALIVVLILITALSIWGDARATIALRTAIARKERADDMIALLNASQFVSLDIDSSRENVERTFAEIRRVVLASVSGPSLQTSGGEGA
ncbi:uncharacterized protein YjbI with pentapeptide repeats [Plasticicumulans lactativorans]|uniref:Uncharacterized protein YjbI with pentapeptide repeats n=2 Tax=Plasticicumulans lactativorans TaxID=1133106 RepID=A0A4R2LLL7_9GAMM|nr:uncharacterized protein YjbI with pentapeptide repeats [Plasticicumulans lactativorans]